MSDVVCGHLTLGCRECSWTGDQVTALFHQQTTGYGHLPGRVIEPACADGDACERPLIHHTPERCRTLRGETP